MIKDGCDVAAAWFEALFAEFIEDPDLTEDVLDMPPPNRCCCN
jgi:hypothetical protein